MIDITKVAEVKVTYSSNIPIRERIKISGSKDMADLMNQWWDKFSPDTKEYVESFAIALLNRANYVLGARCIGLGGTAGTVLDIKVVAQHALKTNAHSIILCHNHPSGNITPSEQDKSLTKTIVNGLKMLDITVLDHIIISGDPDVYYSMADNWDMPQP